MFTLLGRAAEVPLLLESMGSWSTSRPEWMATQIKVLFIQVIYRVYV